MDIRLIRIVAPPTPECFADRLAWSEYLHSAMESKSSATKPFNKAIFNTTFSHCRDCTTEHRRRMVAEKRCNPPVIVRTASAKEIA